MAILWQVRQMIATICPLPQRSLPGLRTPSRRRPGDYGETRRVSQAWNPIIETMARTDRVTE